jgi:hypothetical protein
MPLCLKRATGGLGELATQEDGDILDLREASVKVYRVAPSGTGVPDALTFRPFRDNLGRL